MAEKKKKVSQVAKELGVPGKEFLQVLEKLNIKVKAITSTISEEDIGKVRKVLEKITLKKKETKETKEPKTVKKKPAAKKAKPKTTEPKTTEVKIAEPKKKKAIKEKKPEPVKVKEPAEKQKPVHVAEKHEKKAEVKQVAPSVTEPSKPVEPVKPKPKVIPRIIQPSKPLHLQPRPPIVTVMGHVDHGKTTLLDSIRKTNVAAGEAGAITQHIGAYEVEVTIDSGAKGKIVFLDTPGHEAFTAMRARGAQVTDIVVLVVGADDGIMPQTVEAINHAKAADVPLIVAINKIDKDNANPEQIKQQLSSYNLIPEEWGGDTICVPISALKGTGLNKLLEMILLQAEMLELKADPDLPATGTIIEARLDRFMGPVATVVIKEGTLRVGDSFLVGNVDSEAVGDKIFKVKALINDREERIKEAPPSFPVEVLGFSSVPQVGETITVITDKKLLKDIRDRESEFERQVAQVKRLTLEDLYKQVKEGQTKELRIILKTDVQGSLEALTKALEKLGNEEVKLNVLHKGVGEIGEADIMLASASNAIVIGFSVPVNLNAGKVAKYENVEVRTYDIIYALLDDLKRALEGLLPVKMEEVMIGQAVILNVFKASRIGTIAGLRITDGKITRDAKVRVVRAGSIIYDGKIQNLKRFKDDVREVEKGFECGLALSNFDDIKEGDNIQIYQMQPVKKEGETA